jgi:hypothetical protein
MEVRGEKLDTYSVILYIEYRNRYNALCNQAFGTELKVLTMPKEMPEYDAWLSSIDAQAAL